MSDDIIVTAPPKWLAYAEPLIKQFEGCARKRKDGMIEAYPDPASGGDPITIGWGSTGADIKRGAVWTQEQCDERFRKDLLKFGAAVQKLLAGIPTTPQQQAAMTSFAYNEGIGALASSTLLKRHKAGDYAQAAREFGRYVFAAGKIMPGLVRRRQAEARLYRGEA